MVFYKTLDLKDRISSIRDESSDAQSIENSSPLPTPRFYAEERPFSTKKEKLSQREYNPTPPKLKLIGKSCPPANRHLSRDDFLLQRAKCVSFTESNTSLPSSYYDESNDKSYFEQCFEIISKLGSGSFGDVFKVRSKEDGKYYAIKRSKEKFKGKADRKLKLQEVQKYEQLPSHPNCVRFFKAWEERQRLYIQTELCSYSLSDYAECNHDIPESIVWNFLVDLLLSIKHLHDHNLVHLDIKPDNIFIGEDGVCKLGDFGLTLDLSKSDTADAIEGDSKYLAPELMQSIFTKAADIFSLGITILELASDLDLPRGDEAWHQLRQLKIPEEFLKKISPTLAEVITMMMEPDCSKRPSVDSILQLDAVDSVLKKKKQAPKSIDLDQIHIAVTPPLNDMPNFSEWNCDSSDDVFLCKDSDNKSSEHKYSRLSFTHSDSENSNHEFPRRSGVSTPYGLRYRDNAPLLDTSGSPCLSNSKKKKGLSPGSDSSVKKSLKVQLFPPLADDEDNPEEINIAPRNLMAAFDELSSEESP